jgi:predicted esterase
MKKLDYRVSQDCILDGNESSHVLVCYLHGYQQDCKELYSLFKDNLNPEYLHVFPSGPYSVPVRGKQGWDLKNSWYFFDTEKMYFIRSYEEALNGLRGLLVSFLKVEKVIVVGYSQGGYLCPHLADFDRRAVACLGLNTRFRHEDTYKHNSVMLTQIHGALDETVEHDRSKRSHSVLIERGHPGEFITVDGTGHGLSKAILNRAQEYIDSLVKG